MLQSHRRLAAPLFLVLLLPIPVYAHVKWFSDFDFADRPLTLSQAVTPTVLGLLLLSMVGLAVLVIVDRLLTRMAWYSRFTQWFTDRRHNSELVMRIGLGATLLMAWQGESLLVPRLPIDQGWVGWLQFLLIFLLFFRKTTPYAGWGTAFLYVIGLIDFGWFYMLDYVLFLGVAYYLVFNRHADTVIRGTALPALYVTVGFSLIWPGMEKIFYPQWGLYVLAENPSLALGLPINFFLVAAAFVELVLGYLLIIGLLERPLALVVTLVFFTTTTFFGRVEVLGHTIIHAALIVFLLEGPGDFYKAPITFHKRIPLRMAFASLNFLLVVAFLSMPYAWGAMRTFEHAAAEALENADEDVSFTEVTNAGLPALDFEVSYSRETAWVVDVEVENFTFVERDAAQAIGDGTAYVFRDGELIGVTSSGVYQLRNIDPGTYTFAVSLHAPDGRRFVVEGEPLFLEREVTIGARSTAFSE
jgi:uncharacterized membrane protein YphA (DoxX/SURF4 family)